MGTVITAVYEKGVLRPLTPLGLSERQTVKIQILPADEAGQIVQELVGAGLLTPPAGHTDVTPVNDEERRDLADRIGQATRRPLSQMIIAERNER